MTVLTEMYAVQGLQNTMMVAAVSFSVSFVFWLFAQELLLVLLGGDHMEFQESNLDPLHCTIFPAPSMLTF